MALVTGTDYAYDSASNKYLNTQRATGMPQTLDNPSTLPITSTNVSVWANNMRVGFVQSFTPSEQRTITKVQELGTEGVVQSVPGNTNGGQIAITRFAIYNANLYNALGLTRTGQFVAKVDNDFDKFMTLNDTNNAEYRTHTNPFKTLKDQRVPLELKSKTVLPDVNNSTDSGYKAYTVTYVDCWLSQYSKTVATNQVTVSESATIQYSDVYSGISA